MTITDLAIPLCFFCGLSLTKPKGRGPDNMIEHHISYDPECKVRAHAYCHGYYHRMLYQYHERNDDYFGRVTKQEVFQKRFLNRMRTGRGDGYIPWDGRTHYLPPFSSVLLWRDVNIFEREDHRRRERLKDVFRTRAYEMAKVLGLGPQSTQEDFDSIVKLAIKHNRISTTEHDWEHARDIRSRTMEEYKKRTRHSIDSNLHVWIRRNNKEIFQEVYDKYGRS